MFVLLVVVIVVAASLQAKGAQTNVHIQINKKKSQTKKEKEMLNFGFSCAHFVSSVDEIKILSSNLYYIRYISRQTNIIFPFEIVTLFPFSRRTRRNTR